MPIFARANVPLVVPLARRGAKHPSFDDLLNHSHSSVVSYPSSEMLTHEEASALQPTNAPLVGSASSRLWKPGETQSLAYWLAVKQELDDARPVKAAS
jgi:hypothetical protein